jgi:hypothetical protein
MTLDNVGTVVMGGHQFFTVAVPCMPWHGDTVEHGTVPRRHKCSVIAYRATNCYVVRCHAEASAKYTISCGPNGEINSR